VVEMLQSSRMMPPRISNQPEIILWLKFFRNFVYFEIQKPNLRDVQKKMRETRNFTRRWDG